MGEGIEIEPIQEASREAVGELQETIKKMIADQPIVLVVFAAVFVVLLLVLFLFSRKSSKEVEEKPEVQLEAAKAEMKKFEDEVEKIFRRIDKNGDGTVSKRELRDAIGGSHDIGDFLGIKRTSDTKSWFAKADADNSDSLTLAEFKKYIKVVENSRDKIEEERARGVITDADMQIIKDTFKRCDTDGNGMLDVKELGTAYMKLAKEKGKHVYKKRAVSWAAQALRKYDADGNKGLDQNEFVSLCLTGPFSMIFEAQDEWRKLGNSLSG